MQKQMREMAGNNVEQARVGYTQFMDGMTQATTMWLNAMPSNPMTAGFKAMHKKGAQFAKQNADACFDCASEVVGAKDVKDALAIQGRFAHDQMETYSKQAQEIGKSISNTVAIDPSKS